MQKHTNPTSYKGKNLPAVLLLNNDNQFEINDVSQVDELNYNYLF